MNKEAVEVLKSHVGSQHRAHTNWNTYVHIFGDPYFKYHLPSTEPAFKWARRYNDNALQVPYKCNYPGIRCGFVAQSWTEMVTGHLPRYHPGFKHYPGFIPSQVWSLTHYKSVFFLQVAGSKTRIIELPCGQFDDDFPDMSSS